MTSFYKQIVTYKITLFETRYKISTCVVCFYFVTNEYPKCTTCIGCSSCLPNYCTLPADIEINLLVAGILMSSVGMVENVTFTYCAEHYLVLLVVLTWKIDFIHNQIILIVITNYVCPKHVRFRHLCGLFPTWRHMFSEVLS